MAKFQHLVNVILIVFSHLLLTTSEKSTAISSEETKDINEENGYSVLKLVSVVFRHGDRTIDRLNQESYPNDPYKNSNFYPFGDGHLTNNGKKRSYELGVLLKGIYGDFLGDVYYPSDVYARSTILTRAKMTLQLVLAGLYPPIDIQKWYSELSWQPTDLMYNPLQEDDLFPFKCSTYMKLRNDLLQKLEIKKKIEEFNDLMRMVSIYTGRNITTLEGLGQLYNTLYAESLMELPLPEWTRDIFPNGKLLNATLLFFELFSYEKLNNLNGGILLNTITADMNKVINGTLDRKINLFSAHDINVSGMLYALNATKCVNYTRLFPAYTSSVIIELHEKYENYMKRYFVKVLYYLGIPSYVQEVTIPGCETLCPYDKFVELTKTITLPCHLKIKRNRRIYKNITFKECRN